MKLHLFYDLFDKVQNLEDPLKADGLFAAAKEIYGVTHVLYAKMDGPVHTHQSCFIQGTYSDKWLNHYFAHDFLSIDPVAVHGQKALRPFDWSDLPKDSKKVKRVFNDSIDFGFGTQGLSIPIVNLHGERALFNINAEASDREWKAQKPRLMRDFHIISHFLHHAIVEKMSFDAGPSHDILSDRELESLKWAASGKSAWETSVILSVSERTVRFHLDQARRKLSCTSKIQAVAKAVATGLINIS